MKKISYGVGMVKHHITSRKFFEKGKEISAAYGFTPLNEVMEQLKGTPRVSVPAGEYIANPRLRHPSLILRMYLERGLDEDPNSEPLFVFYSNSEHTCRKTLTSSNRAEPASITLCIIGLDNAYAEVSLVSSATHILNELGVARPKIRINSMGTDRDAENYFSLLQDALHRHKECVSPECETMLRTRGVVEAHPYLYQNDHAGVLENLTPTLRILSEGARNRFESIIHYLELERIPYELANDLVEYREYGEHGVIEMIDADAGMYVRGGCYNNLAEYLYNRQVPCTSITITHCENADASYVSKTKKPKANLFLVQSGKLAQQRSLQVLKEITQIQVPVAHRLYRKKISEQLEGVEKQYPYLLILGQEEVEANIIRLKDTETQAYTIINKHNLHTLKKYIS